MNNVIPLSSSRVSEANAVGFQGTFSKKVFKKNKLFQKNFISVIVPIYNVEQFLPDCINSILRQTFQDIEILLVNDGSTDKSGELADEYAKQDQRIKVIHKENGGLSSARNAGLKFAKGEYISFIDSDDWIELNTYKQLYEAAVDNNADIVMCEIIREYTYDSVSKHMKSPFQEDIYKGEAIKKVLLPNIIGPSNCISQSKDCYSRDDMLGSVCRNLYRSEMLTKNKLDFDEQIRYCEDTVFNVFAFSLAKTVKILKFGLYHYRSNPHSLMHSYYKDPNYVDIVLYSYNKLLHFADRKKMHNEIYDSIYFRVNAQLNAMIMNTYIVNAKHGLLKIFRALSKLIDNNIIKASCSDSLLSYPNSHSLKHKLLCFSVKNRQAFIIFIYAFIWYKLRFKKVTTF